MAGMECHVDIVTYVMSAWMRSEHGMWAYVRTEECSLALALNLCQAPRELLSCYHTLSRCAISRYSESYHDGVN